jgi:hypothetical protein
MMTDHDPLDVLLDELRTDVPAMSDQAFAAGLARVRAITETAPVPAVPEPASVVTPLRKRRLLRSPPRLVASAAAVVALVAGVLVVQAVRSDDAAPVASAAAAAQLNSAADRIDTTDVPLGPGQYRYLATHTWGLSTSQLADADGNLSDMGLSYLSEVVSELWVPADPTQECLQRQGQTGKYKWVVGDDEKARAAGVELPKPESSDLRIPCGDFPDGWWQRPSTEFVASLPRDPGQLYDRLRRDTEGHGMDPDLEMLVYATDALSTGQIPADLRAALYRVLARVPGMTITEQVANLDGHKGTAFGISRAGMRQDVIIDPVTGDFIGGRLIDLDGVSGAPAGSVTSYSSVSAPVVVDQIGVKPAG